MVIVFFLLIYFLNAFLITYVFFWLESVQQLTHIKQYKRKNIIAMGYIGFLFLHFYLSCFATDL